MMPRTERSASEIGAGQLRLRQIGPDQVQALIGILLPPADDRFLALQNRLNVFGVGHRCDSWLSAGAGTEGFLGGSDSAMIADPELGREGGYLTLASPSLSLRAHKGGLETVRGNG